MNDLLLLPEGWPRQLLLACAAGLLAMIWLRRSWLESLREPEAGESAPAEAEEAPGVARSLFIVARNEEAHLPGLLEDLEALLDEDPRLEIHLADDSSDDQTRSLLAEFGLERERVYLQEPGPAQGKAAWLRHMVPQARGSLLLFSDADCRLPRRWSLALEECLRAEELAAGGGPVLLLDSGGAPGILEGWQRLHWQLLSGVAAAWSRRSAFKGRPGTPSLWGGNLAVRREALEPLGGYAACATGNRNEDLELVRRLSVAGLPLGLRLKPRALRVRTHPVSWSGWASQTARWAQGLGRLAPAHALAVLAAGCWLASLLLILLLKPLLGLLLGLVAAQALSALSRGLAESVEEPALGVADCAGYLAMLPILALCAALSAARSALLGSSRNPRP